MDNEIAACLGVFLMSLVMTIGYSMAYLYYLGAQTQTVLNVLNVVLGIQVLITVISFICLLFMTLDE
jgi:hypothetical protein